MKALLRSRFLALAVMVLAVPASAGPFEDGLTAYEREDYATALKFWRPLAEQGHAGVQYNLGIMYEDGLGVPQDDAEVVKWYRMAAEQGVAKAQASLGFMYAKGRGVEQDDTKAIKWYRKAAEQGLDRAQYNLGLMYAMGRGVSRDTVKAHIWFTIAARQGVELAKRGRDLAANKLTPDQIAEAQRMAREWMAKHQR
jgi:TPR repeat protein